MRAGLATSWASVPTFSDFSIILESCFLLRRTQSQVASRAARELPCCLKERRASVATHLQRHTEHPPRSEAASFLAPSCFLRCLFTVINCVENQAEAQSCDLRKAWRKSGTIRPALPAPLPSTCPLAWLLHCFR